MREVLKQICFAKKHTKAMKASKHYDLTLVNLGTRKISSISCGRFVFHIHEKQLLWFWKNYSCDHFLIVIQTRSCFFTERWKKFFAGLLTNYGTSNYDQMYAFYKAFIALLFGIWHWFSAREPPVFSWGVLSWGEHHRLGLVVFAIFWRIEVVFTHSFCGIFMA